MNTLSDNNHKKNVNELICELAEKKKIKLKNS